ncbi:MAG: hypothetical protein ACLPWF_09870 [Bryobacteraceae bacterium]
MRHFFTRSIPPFSRILLIESGSRELIERLLPVLYQNHPGMTCDLVTCYAGLPKNFRENQGAVYRVTDYPAGPARQRFYQELGANRYNIVGVICSAEPIMTKWKWMLAARLPGKVFVVNENGDYFWMDYGHWSNIRYFVLFRAGLTGSGAVRTIARVVLFPFSLLYLVLYAITVHSRRILRTL